MAKVVLITGGNTGIGEATAIEFANKGYNVVITYLSGSYEFLDKEYTAIKADITKQKDINKIFSTIKKKYGELNVLVNNAAIMKHSTFKTLKMDDFRKTFEVNVFSTYNLITKLKPLMKKGSIVNIGSIRGIEPSVHDIDYGATKAAMINLTKVLSKEFAPSIRVNSVSPGITKTNMVKDYKKACKVTASKSLLKRMADPSEIAEAIIFMSEASYVTGQNLIVDGGYCIN